VGERVFGAVEAESTFENYSTMFAKLLCFMLGSVRDRVWLEKYWLIEEQSAAGDEVWTLRYDSAREPLLVGVILGPSRSRGVRGLHALATPQRSLSFSWSEVDIFTRSGQEGVCGVWQRFHAYGCQGSAASFKPPTGYELYRYGRDSHYSST
jgi:hypothetical protein